MFDNVKLAPTDPERARPFFYIMKDKEIFLQEQPDGTGKCFIYEDSGRLISSAKLVGNIDDDNILELLKTTEGFKKLVYGIGVSIECEDSTLRGRFVFQMYGKNDLYGGGTNLISEQNADGMEHRIYLKDISWSSDDNEPGQIRFECDKKNIPAAVSVRFFLNDGYSAPEYIEDKEVDITSDGYREMIGRSIIAKGDLTRIKRAVKRAKEGEDVTIAFIGGSITQGAGATPINTECYAYKTYKYFADKFGTGNNVHFVKAGIGGTPSELGVIRYERDVLRYGAVTPDIVVVEFAVNDDNDETLGDCYESLVRKILKKENAPAVIMEFSVFANDFNLEDRLVPVGKRLSLPMVSVKQAVLPQFNDIKNRVLSKNQFFYDIFHPTSLGHTIMADGIKHLFDIADEELSKEGTGDDKTKELLKEAPAIGKTYEDIVLLDKKDNTDIADIFEGSFKFTDENLQAVELDTDLTLTKMFPYNFMYDGIRDNEKPYFELSLTAKAVIVINKDAGEPDVGVSSVYVDGKYVRDIDPHVNNWTHCNPLLVLNATESGLHKIRIEIKPEDKEKKFTILGFGIVR